MIKKIPVLLFAAIALVFLAGYTDYSDIAPSDIVIIANIESDADTISASQVQNIFLGQVKSFSKERVYVCVMKKNDLHEAFLMHYVKKTPSQFLNHWKRLVFSGKANMPPIVKDEQEMIENVIKNKGAIGYISSNSERNYNIPLDKVKILKIQ